MPISPAIFVLKRIALPRWRELSKILPANLRKELHRKNPQIQTDRLVSSDYFGAITFPFTVNIDEEKFEGSENFDIYSERYEQNKTTRLRLVSASSRARYTPSEQIHPEEAKARSDALKYTASALVRAAVADIAISGNDEEPGPVTVFDAVRNMPFSFFTILSHGLLSDKTRFINAVHGSRTRIKTDGDLVTISLTNFPFSSGIARAFHEESNLTDFYYQNVNRALQFIKNSH